MAELLPITAAEVACKCCGGAARLFGVVDFNKNCEANRGRYPLPLAGVPVYYHRCTRCGFLFTVAFDAFTHADFATHIYNAQYALVDPDYEAARPAAAAGFIANTFPQARPLRVLDFGGGNGRMAELLRQAGFADVTTYDPFVPARA